MAHGVKPESKRLFVIDGAKTVRASINRVFGPQHPERRCRNHKISNVVERLLENQKDQVKAAVRASYRLEAKKASPGSANGLLEGLGSLATGSDLRMKSKRKRCGQAGGRVRCPRARLFNL